MVKNCALEHLYRRTDGFVAVRASQRRHDIIPRERDRYQRIRLKPHSKSGLEPWKRRRVHLLRALDGYCSLQRQKPTPRQRYALGSTHDADLNNRGDAGTFDGPVEIQSVLRMLDLL